MVYWRGDKGRTYSCDFNDVSLGHDGVIVTDKVIFLDISDPDLGKCPCGQEQHRGCSQRQMHLVKLCSDDPTFSWHDLASHLKSLYWKLFILHPDRDGIKRLSLPLDMPRLLRMHIGTFVACLIDLPHSHEAMLTQHVNVLNRIKTWDRQGCLAYKLQGPFAARTSRSSQSPWLTILLHLRCTRLR